MRNHPWLVGILLLGACTGTGINNGPGAGTDAAGPGPGSDASVTNTPPDLTALPPPPDLTGLSSVNLSIGPIPLGPGEERTVCTVFHLPNGAALDVVNIDAKLAPGSHHLIFYKSNLTQEQLTPMNCQPLDIGFGQMNPKNIPVFIAETQADNNLPLPAGVAYHFDAGQMIKLEAHYLNASAAPITGMGTVTLTAAAAGAKVIPADIMFCGSVLDLYTKGVPPGQSTLTPGFYKPPGGTKIFGLTTHQHRAGTLMTIGKSTSANDPGAELVHGQPWDNEPFVKFDDQHLLEFSPNEGLRWQCSYNNTGKSTLHFGESAASDEMCFLWAYYYPSVGHFISAECLR